jgi:hypothetical protein
MSVGCGHLARDESSQFVRPASRYIFEMAAMPQPGDRYAQAFTVEPGRCWAMIHDRQGQATHCPEAPSWTGRWFSPNGDRWWRVWSCPDHLEGLTGLREFGRVP